MATVGVKGLTAAASTVDLVIGSHRRSEFTKSHQQGAPERPANRNRQSSGKPRCQMTGQGPPTDRRAHSL